MDASAVLVIGGVCGSLAKVLTASGVRGVWATVASALVSLISTALWAFSHGPITRASAFDYWSGYAAVLLITAGAFHVIDQTPNAARSMTQ